MSIRARRAFVKGFFRPRRAIGTEMVSLRTKKALIHGGASVPGLDPDKRVIRRSPMYDALAPLSTEYCSLSPVPCSPFPAS